MIFSGKSKGITPVIAIVLLLLITVGAIGIVAPQINNLLDLGGAQDDINSITRAQSASYDITAMNETSSGNYGVVLKNTGDVTYNLSAESTLLMGVNGGDNVAVTARGGNDCGETFGVLRPGDSAFCDTGISWDSDYENDGQSTDVQLQIGNNVKARYSCTESGDTFC